MNKIIRKQKAQKEKFNQNNLRPTFLSALLANLLVFAILSYCYWLIQNDKGLYLSIVQEDEYIEWATTWAFLFASVGCVFGAIRGNNKFKDFQWFYIGLSIFCFLVAMEEISWGQRIFGYRPPVYFLENNYQQEFTIHNLISKYVRIITVKVVIIGYGVILPLLMLIPSLRRLLNSMRVVVPPFELIPAFFSVFYIYHTYPWEYTGEVIELMLAMCFLFTILFRLWDFKPVEMKQRGLWQFTTILGAVLITIGFSFGTANRSTHMEENNSIVLDNCHTELEAIKKDLVWGATQLGRSFIKKYPNIRIYTMVKKNDFDWMFQRQYADLSNQGLPQDRADFFIDPWNMAYWLMFRFDKVTGRQRIVVYSFGPNRKRDSDDWAIKGDDVGIIILDTGLKHPYISENEILPKGN
jgi:uncharacterized membrane protein